MCFPVCNCNALGSVCYVQIENMLNCFNPHLLNPRELPNIEQSPDHPNPQPRQML